MKINIKIINYLGKIYNIIKSDHTHDNRKTYQYSRDEFIDDKRYIEIVKLALINGLSSFRDKGQVVISFLDFTGKPFAILLDLTDNDIFIISVYAGNRRYPWSINFIKVKNRINLYTQYTLSKMTSKERELKKKQMIFSDIDKEIAREKKLFSTEMRKLR